MLNLDRLRAIKPKSLKSNIFFYDCVGVGSMTCMLPNLCYRKIIKTTRIVDLTSESIVLSRTGPFTL